jgi:hypothetical protein
MDSSCEGCYYNHTVTEKDNAILEECPKLNKYIAEQLKNNIGENPKYFWRAMFLGYALCHIYDEKGREGLREAEKTFVESNS